MGFAFIVLNMTDISWTVAKDGQSFTGSDPLDGQLSESRGDYMVLLSNVINRLQEQHGKLEFNFRRG